MSTALRDRDIILVASAPWTVYGQLNCHHIARRLAAGNRVLYVESPGLRAPSLTHGSDLWRIGRRLAGWLSCLAKGPRPVSPNLFVLSPLVLPVHGHVRLERLNTALLARACRRAVRALHFRKPLFWSFLPTVVDCAWGLNTAATIYHCVDDYASNPGVNATAIEAAERRMTAQADLCFATSRPLADRLSQYGAQVICVPNVAESERFALPASACPTDMAAVPRPRIGYVGNISSYKVDFELLAEVAARRPQWSLALVGPVGSGDPATSVASLQGRKNVYFLGPKSYAELPGYVHALDVCLIPFRRSRVTDASFPLKTFEYLAAGKPVVSRPLASLTAEPLDDVIAYARTADEFIESIERSLREDPAGTASRRRQVAARYSWTERFPQIEQAVAAVLNEGEQRP